jgi:hypothetical protein
MLIRISFFFFADINRSKYGAKRYRKKKRLHKICLDATLISKFETKDFNWLIHTKLFFKPIKEMRSKKRESIFY